MTTRVRCDAAPKRHGVLFDPERFVFLEGRASNGPRHLDERIEPPLVPDGTIYRALEKLLVLDGERISYRALDVEQIGSVYETMMGFRLETATGRSVAIKSKKKQGAPTAVDLEALLAEPAAKREKWLKSEVEQIIASVTTGADRPDFTPSTDTAVSDTIKALDINALLALDIPPRDFTLSDILRVRDLVMVYRWRGIGKTYLALDMAYAIASGGKCLRWSAPDLEKFFTWTASLAGIIAASDKQPPVPDFFCIVTPDAHDFPIPSLCPPRCRHSLMRLSETPRSSSSTASRRSSEAASRAKQRHGHQRRNGRYACDARTSP